MLLNREKQWDDEMRNGKNVLVCLFILCGLMGFLILYGENNYTELVFSKESGFYEKPFELELHAPRGTKIYYTLDGSEPDKEAIRYTEPIHIGDVICCEL